MIRKAALFNGAGAASSSQARAENGPSEVNYRAAGIATISVRRAAGQIVTRGRKS
jgi:hypothetical protein